MYDTAVLEANVSLNTHQINVISTMVDILELELKILNKKINSVYCNAVFNLSKVLTNINHLDVGDTHVLIYSPYDQHCVSLLKSTSMSVTQIYSNYKEINKLSDDIYIPNSLDDTKATRIRPLINGFRKLVLGLLVHPIDDVATKGEALAITGMLRKFSQLVLTKKSTKQTAVDLENTNPSSLTCRTLIDLVQKTITKTKQKKT